MPYIGSYFASPAWKNHNMRSNRRAGSGEVGYSPRYSSYRVDPSGVWIVNHVVTPMASGRFSSARTHVDRHLGSSQSSALIQRKNVPREASSTRLMFS